MDPRVLAAATDTRSGGTDYRSRQDTRYQSTEHGGFSIRAGDRDSTTRDFSGGLAGAAWRCLVALGVNMYFDDDYFIAPTGPGPISSSTGGSSRIDDILGRILGGISGAIRPAPATPPVGQVVTPVPPISSGAVSTNTLFLLAGMGVLVWALSH